MHLPPNISAQRSRLAVGSAFFLNGLCFSTWASRIPTIQHKLGLSVGVLGSLLFALPLGSILSSFFSSGLMMRMGIRRTLSTALLVCGLTYISIGLVTTPALLALCLFIIGCLSNVISVAANTQAVRLEQIMQRPIMASLHGLWSMAGFIGAAIGSVMMGYGIDPLWHFSLIFLVLSLGVWLNSHAFLQTSGLSGPRPGKFVRPTRSLLGLGFVAFCSMICEGAMFDWSGVYFKSVLHASDGKVGLGYGAFMGAMATSRFFADHLTMRFGARHVLTASGILVFFGLGTAVAFPSVWIGVLGFMLVGIGTAAVVPLVYSCAGKTKDMAPSAAIAATSTIGFVAFLLGPPLIGWIAGFSSLRWSFLVVAFMGLGIALVGRQQFEAPLPEATPSS